MSHSNSTSVHHILLLVNNHCWLLLNYYYYPWEVEKERLHTSPPRDDDDDECCGLKRSSTQIWFIMLIAKKQWKEDHKRSADRDECRFRCNSLCRPKNTNIHRGWGGDDEMAVMKKWKPPFVHKMPVLAKNGWNRRSRSHLHYMCKEIAVLIKQTFLQETKKRNVFQWNLFHFLNSWSLLVHLNFLVNSFLSLSSLSWLFVSLLLLYIWNTD